MKTIVIGGGASGIIAALKASENSEVIILEKNDKLGKKLLLTGNGNCNYWNENINIDNYYTDNKDILNSILNNKEEVFNYLSSLGIYPKNKNGYLYPYSMSASSFKTVLENHLKKNNINIIYNADVKDFNYDNGFTVYYNDTSITSDKLIISTGSKSYPKTGSDGNFYNLLKDKGFLINPVLPALTSLYSEEKYFKDWSGVRSDAKISLYIDDKLVKKEEGEVQLTDYGISGICVFNLSGYASRALNDNKKVSVSINFAPFTDDFYHFMSERCKLLNNYELGPALESIYNYKLLNVLLKYGNIDYYDHLDDINKDVLESTFCKLSFDITKTGSYEKSQVCTGGVSLNEVNNNLESKRISNLYLVGEILDVDGICGGYNLAFAFISGFVAASSIKKED